MLCVLVSFWYILYIVPINLVEVGLGGCVGFSFMKQHVCCF